MIREVIHEIIITPSALWRVARAVARIRRDPRPAGNDHPPMTYFSRADIEFFRTWFRNFFRIFHFIRFKGAENCPTDGPCLLASNHVCYYDPLMIAAGQTRPMRFMAWNALFNHGIFGPFIRDIGAFPVDLDGKDPGGFKICNRLLREGNQIGIFPEGERSWDGVLLPLREGVVRLAMRNDVPIVPVCIRGGEMAWPRGDLAPRLFRPITVEYFPPIRPRPTRTIEERHAESARIAAELRAVLLSALGQEDPPPPPDADQAH